MAFDYEALVSSAVLPTVATAVITNSVSTERLFVRTVVLNNIGAGVGIVELFLVPNVAGALGTQEANDRFHYASLAQDEEKIVEYPVPGIILEYNDAIYAVCDTADTINCIITGGREY